MPVNARFVDNVNPRHFDVVICHNLRHVRMVKDWHCQKVYIFHFCPTDGTNIREEYAERLKNFNIIFNNHTSQKEWALPNKKQRVIWHGFDPNEWPVNQGTYDGVLTVCSKFSNRPHVTGYNLWKEVVGRGDFDYKVVGNDKKLDIVQTDSWDHLRKLMRDYRVYFSPTLNSPMPRSRGEAFMSGMPMVSTSAQDADLFIEDGVSGYLADEPEHILEHINELLRNKRKRTRLGRNAREKAVEVFHIDRYLNQWRELLSDMGVG
jgi:glycosyltransferase involved in cell wall biosynthesis